MNQPMTDSKPELKISVISDYICPFCFIGHRRLQRLRDDYELKINWCLVEIHPETPVEGQPVTMLNYSDDYWDQLMQNLKRLADEEGIELAEHTMTSNSRQALLLAEASKALGAAVFYPLHERLFEACFVDGMNIGDEQVLRQIAAECGIPDNLVEQAWSDPFTHGPADQVPAPLLPYLQYAGAINARSVPTFVFGKELLSGAVEPGLLRQGRAC
jgi:predicted DsbA family dithiol-disulfide isomerase